MFTSYFSGLSSWKISACGAWRSVEEEWENLAATTSKRVSGSFSPAVGHLRPAYN
jgi:hypothetical protein